MKKSKKWLTNLTAGVALATIPFTFAACNNTTTPQKDDTTGDTIISTPTDNTTSISATQIAQLQAVYESDAGNGTLNKTVMTKDMAQKLLDAANPALQALNTQTTHVVYPAAVDSNTYTIKNNTLTKEQAGIVLNQVRANMLAAPYTVIDSVQPEADAFYPDEQTGIPVKVSHTIKDILCNLESNIAFQDAYTMMVNKNLENDHSEYFTSSQVSTYWVTADNCYCKSSSKPGEYYYNTINVPANELNKFRYNTLLFMWVDDFAALVKEDIMLNADGTFEIPIDWTAVTDIKEVYKTVLIINDGKIAKQLTSASIYYNGNQTDSTNIVVDANVQYYGVDDTFDGKDALTRPAESLLNNVAWMEQNPKS